jgi:hypothetical protein
MRELKRRKLEKQFASIDQDEPDYYGGNPEEIKEMIEAEALNVSFGLVELKNFLNHELPWGLVTTGRGLTSHEEESLRQEIIQDIGPIVSPPADADVLDALEKLVEKINAMRLQLPWAVAVKPDDKQKIEHEGPLAESDFGYIGPAGPVMRIGGKQLIVSHQLNQHIWPDRPDSQKGCYRVIITTLEDASFQKLKRCKECSRFFIADRLSEKFCRPECSKTYFDRGAVDRVRKSRAKPQVEEKRQVGKKQKKRRTPASVKGNRRKHAPNMKVKRRSRKASKT